MTDNTPLNADNELRKHNELDSLFTKVLMEQHSHDWDMETIREAAVICSNLAIANRKKHELQAKKNGFYMAAGLFGADISRIEELWDKCEKELEKL